MADHCVVIDGALVRVSAKFDTTEGSADMVAMKSLLKAVRENMDETEQESDPK